MIKESIARDMGWNFNNSYESLAPLFYRKIGLSPVREPNLVVLNEQLAGQLGLNPEVLAGKEGVEIFSGNEAVAGGSYLAQAYGGHQFGHFTMLGDGRAVLIGEQITPSGQRYDVQLKGSGITPYSRRGDGRAALGPMLREYIISEGMYGMGIPTTRSLAVVKTGEVVYREKKEQGAILTRVAASHIRFGTFEYVAQFGNREQLKELADYTINRHYPEVQHDEDQYLQFLRQVIDRFARLMAQWQSVGFIHGVMNTDNMSICGESIDYGPCAFMDRYDPATVFSSIDTHGRYSYQNQPAIAQWNLCRLAETLLPLLADDENRAVQIAGEALGAFSDLYERYWIEKMGAKIGLQGREEQDKPLIEGLLNLMEQSGEDYTNTFASLTTGYLPENGMFVTNEFSHWYEQWQRRLARQGISREQVQRIMKGANPMVIPRNHRVEEAIEGANQGNFIVMNQLVEAIVMPYEYKQEYGLYMEVPTYCGEYRTFCGT